MGAILRSAAFFGLDQLLLLGRDGMRKVSPVVSKVLEPVMYKQQLGVLTL